ncbi:Aste57867_8257 [Aphanomyces stellatus]|uniref:Aste57867_8257 protein n=1 Tax=Aphanomyces stellatus TaxID=120398 RepID=A0A485KJS0_9STRA|nr:hypothetical protein As57867_008226 [Aphanomyces stellatus]VFT85144.1 Aste57867_8257 [Aphanomyces stellatus]
MLSEGSLDGLVVSLVPGSTLEEIGADGIAAIPRTCREFGVQDLRKIHDLGVLHGDVADRNLILHNVKGRCPRIFFVGFGRADADDINFEGEVYALPEILQLF